MAILTFAAPISGLRGKVGGNVYSANKSGPYVKAWGRGSNPRSTSQTNHRHITTRFSQNWASLTNTERLTWDVYAALPAQDKTNSLGETYSISGFNWYVAINTNLNNAGALERNSAPTTGTPGTPIIQEARLATTASGTQSFIRLTGASPGLTDPLAVYLVIKNSVGASQVAEIKSYMNSDIPDGIRTVNFQDEVEARFGEIQATQVGHFLVRSQSSQGRQGAEDTAIDEA